MSTHNTLGSLTRAREQAEHSRMYVAAVISKHVARDGGDEAVTDAFMARGGSPMLRKSPDILTSATFGGAPLSAAFVGQVDRESIVGRIVPGLRLPPLVPMRVQTLDIEASTVGEGNSKPIARPAFTVDPSTPTKHVAMVVVSDDLLRAVDAVTLDSLHGMIVSATAAAVDTALVAAWTSGTPTAGSTATLATIGALLNAISGGAPRRPYVIGSFATLAPLADSIDGLGKLGVTVLTTPAAGSRLIAVDGAGLVLSDAGAEVIVGRHASVSVSDGGSPEVFSTISLFQNNMSALRGERFLSVRGRANAFAFANIS